MTTPAQYPVQMIISAMDRVSAPFRQIESRMAAMRSSLSALSRASGMNRLSEGVRGLGAAFGGVLTQVRSLAGPMLAIAGIGGVIGIGAMIGQTATLGDELAKLSQRTGVAVESIQKWSYVAAMSGSSQEEMTAGLEAFNRSTAEARQRGSEAGRMFRALGVNIRGANGTLKTNDALLWEVQGKLHKIKDPTLRAAVTSKLLGDATGSLVGVLGQERSHLEALMKEKERHGLLTTEETKAAEAFKASQTRLGSAFSGLFQTLSAKVLPVLQPFIDRMTEAIAAHKGDIVQRFSTFLEGMAQNLAKIDFKTVIAGVFNFFSRIDRAIASIGGFENAVYLLLAVMAGPLLAAVASATSAVVTLGVALMATPVGWFIAAVAAIAGAVYMIYDNWNGIVAWFTGKLDAVKAAFGDGFLNGLWELFKQFNPFTLWHEALFGLVEYLFGIDIGGYLSKQFDALTASLPDWAQGWFGDDKPAAGGKIAGAGDGETARPMSSLPHAGGGGVAPAGPVRMAPPPLVAAQQQKVQVDSKADIRVKLDLPPGVTAAMVGKTSSGPTDFALDTGHSSMP